MLACATAFIKSMKKVVESDSTCTVAPKVPKVSELHKCECFYKGFVP